MVETAFRRLLLVSVGFVSSPPLCGLSCHWDWAWLSWTLPWDPWPKTDVTLDNDVCGAHKCVPVHVNTYSKSTFRKLKAPLKYKTLYLSVTLPDSRKLWQTSPSWIEFLCLQEQKAGKFYHSPNCSVPAHNIIVKYNAGREMEQKPWQLPRGIKCLLCIPAAAGYPETY